MQKQGVKTPFKVLDASLAVKNPKPYVSSVIENKNPLRTELPLGVRGVRGL